MGNDSSARQVWVKAVVWHPTNVSLRLTTIVFLDTGAGGGNYASESFIKSVESTARHGHSIINKRGQGLLTAANPADSKVPPMKILGSTELPLVFPPEDRVHVVTVRVVDSLPYGLIIGAAFLRKNGSFLNFANDGGFKPTRGAAWVPFMTHGKPISTSPRKHTKGWKDQSVSQLDQFGAITSHYYTQHPFCALKPPEAEEEPPDIGVPTHIPTIGDAVWEDDGTLQWILYNTSSLRVDGFVSVEIQAYVKGPQPQDRQLVLLTPLPPFDLELQADLGMARGVQWWHPYTPLKGKMVNVTNAPITLQRGKAIANVYTLNASDVERMTLLDETHRRVPVGKVFIDDVHMEEPSTQPPSPEKVNLAEANMGQLNPRIKRELMDLLTTYRDKGLFALNPKSVKPCKGAPMELPLIDEFCTPFAAKPRRWSPEEVIMIQSEVEKLEKAEVIRRSTSPWAASLVLVRKKDGTLRICQDYRVLNQRLISNSGALGDITTIYSDMGRVGCTSSIDLASGFNQIAIAEKDKHKTAFHDAHGQLWEFNQSGFGLKVLPACFASLVSTALGSLKNKGVRIGWTTF